MIFRRKVRKNRRSRGNHSSLNVCLSVNNFSTLHNRVAERLTRSYDPTRISYRSMHQIHVQCFQMPSISHTPTRPGRKESRPPLHAQRSKQFWMQYGGHGFQSLPNPPPRFNALSKVGIPLDDAGGVPVCNAIDFHLHSRRK